MPGLLEVPHEIRTGVSPGDRTPLRGERPQCNGLKANITLNWHWTLGLIEVYGSSSWRDYKGTIFLFWGGRRRVPVPEEELASQKRRRLLNGGLAEL